MRHSSKLLEQIFETAKKQGLRAGDLAAKAGIPPESLSRIRRTGRFNADTLERLIAAVDGEITLKTRTKAKSATLPIVAKKLNAGRRETVSSSELRQLLTRFYPSKTSERAFSHLVGVIEETPLSQVHDLVLQGSATLPSLRRIVNYVDGEGEVADWINEQTTQQQSVAQAS